MMIPFLGAIARNVDLDCMKYFLGLGLIIKVRMSIVGQFTGYSMIRIESYDPADGLCSLSWRPQIFVMHTNIRGAGIIACLGSCAFGVYLLEHIGQKLFLKLYLQLADRTFGIFACSVYICCILLFSFVCTWLIRKSKIVRKFI